MARRARSTSCERHQLKPTQYEVHEALADLYETQRRRPRRRSTTSARFHALERAVQSEAARDKLRALQIQFELTRGASARPSSSASGRRR